MRWAVLRLGGGVARGRTSRCRGHRLRPFAAVSTVETDLDLGRRAVQRAARLCRVRETLVEGKSDDDVTGGATRTKVH